MAVKGNVTGGATISGGKLDPVVADTGPQGLSAYQVWLAAGNVGTEAQYMASLVSKTAGPNGWTPVIAGELDGTRTLIKVVDWVGGQGTKPDVGMYIGTTGYVTTKAAGFNFNATKRVISATGVTNSSGIATIDLTQYAFGSVPYAVALPATTVALSGPTRSTIVANSTTKTSVQVKVEQQAIVTGLVSVLAGALANVLLIEA